jgi:Toprim-like/Protein of unknown function (DUF3991)
MSCATLRIELCRFGQTRPRARNIAALLFILRTSCNLSSELRIQRVYTIRWCADINRDHPMTTMPARGDGVDTACAAAPAREASPRPLARLSEPFDRALARPRLRGRGEEILQEKGMVMDRNEVEALRVRVGCAALLEGQGFAIDCKQSTRGAVKFRRGDEVLIVIHGDRGWFDARSDAKGDVFALASYLTGAGFAGALNQVAELVGALQSLEAWKEPAAGRVEPFNPARWIRRRVPWRGSITAEYLAQGRALSWGIVAAAIARDLLREGPHGSVWAKHTDAAGSIIGWEERGPNWRGFATGGAKELFRFGPPTAPRICVTEAAIDAMSLAALEGLRDDTLYVSTGGGWAPRTNVALDHYAARAEVHLIAATDADIQGDIYADSIRRIADAGRCDFSRLRPKAEDWNEELKRRGEGYQLAPARSAHQG